MADDLIDQSTLPSAQYLMLETLAARLRLGETYWTFPSKLSSVARTLESKGLVKWKSGVAERTIHVWLTEAGKGCCLSPEYVCRD